MIIIRAHKDGFVLEHPGAGKFFLSSSDALMFTQAVDRFYHIEDVKNELENDNGIDETKVTDEEIEKICDEYESRLEDDDSWSFMLRDVISEFKNNKQW